MAERSFARAMADAADGIAATLRQQRNFRIQVVLGMLAVVAAAVLHFDAGRWAILALTIGAVLGAELVNTSLEHAVDCASPSQSQLARAAKHAGAGAVLLVCIAALAVGAFLYCGAVLELIHRGR